MPTISYICVGLPPLMLIFIEYKTILYGIKILKFKNLLSVLNLGYNDYCLKPESKSSLINKSSKDFLSIERIWSK